MISNGRLSLMPARLVNVLNHIVSINESDSSEYAVHYNLYRQNEEGFALGNLLDKLDITLASYEIKEGI